MAQQKDEPCAAARQVFNRSTANTLLGVFSTTTRLPDDARLQLEQPIPQQVLDVDDAEPARIQGLDRRAGWSSSTSKAPEVRLVRRVDLAVRVEIPPAARVEPERTDESRNAGFGDQPVHVGDGPADGSGPWPDRWSLTSRYPVTRDGPRCTDARQLRSHGGGH